MRRIILGQRMMFAHQNTDEVIDVIRIYTSEDKNSDWRKTERWIRMNSESIHWTNIYIRRNILDFVLNFFSIVLLDDHRDLFPFFSIKSNYTMKIYVLRSDDSMSDWISVRWSHITNSEYYRYSLLHIRSSIVNVKGRDHSQKDESTNSTKICHRSSYLTFIHHHDSLERYSSVN